MSTLQIPLNIPDVEILKQEIDGNGNIIVTVRSTVDGAHCRKCRRWITKHFEAGSEITLRHLPILGRKVYIRIRPVRYQCPYCDGKPTTTAASSWYDRKSPHTRAYEGQALLALINSTIEDVSIKEDLGYKAVEGIVNRWINAEVDWSQINRLSVLGIDEISLRKGHKDFVAIITGRIGERIILLGVLKDRNKATVKNFLLSIPKRLRRQVKCVVSDMYDGFINAVKEVLGSKVIVIDRFHVAKLYRKGLDDLRKKELKRLKKELTEDEYKQLKGAMWILRKDKDKLSSEEKEVLECLFKHSPLLKETYDFCNDLTSIFNEEISKDDAKSKISTWSWRVRASALKCFDTFLKTLSKRIEHITNYFVDRQTSGFVEGLNNKIKVIKRRCYGITNVKHMFQRIYLDLEGYSIFR